MLVRADAIVVLALGPEGLRAGCGTGRAVRLTGTPCSTALMLGLVAAIERAGQGDNRAVIIMPPAEPESVRHQLDAGRHLDPYDVRTGL